jgi:hypothetical protein
MDRLVLILDFHAEGITYFKVQIIYTVIRQIVLPCGQTGVQDTYHYQEVIDPGLRQSEVGTVG